MLKGYRLESEEYVNIVPGFRGFGFVISAEEDYPGDDAVRRSSRSIVLRLTCDSIAPEERRTSWNRKNLQGLIELEGNEVK